MTIWRTLGIARTDDARAIRKAYAAKLKTIDVDADPNAFIALREARDRALARLAGATAATQSVSLEPAFADHHEPPSCVDQPAQPTLQARDEQAERDRQSARFIHLEALLFGEEEPDPEELTAATRAILEHPEMGHVDHAGSVEDWLAAILCDAVPRSDPVLPLTARHFGWENELGTIHQRYALAAAAGRADDLLCLERLRDPSHRWHAAFALLSRPAPPGVRPALEMRLRHKSSIAELLESLRFHNPGVEVEALDRGHVAMWNMELASNPPLPANAPRISWFSWLALVWLALLIVRLWALTIGAQL